MLPEVTSPEMTCHVTGKDVSHVTGSDVSHMTGSDVSHVTRSMLCACATGSRAFFLL